MRHLAKFNVPLFLQRKRSRKADNRLRRERRLSRALCGDRQRINLALGKKSEILELIRNARGKSTRATSRKGHIYFKAPKSFSLIDNPAETLHALSHFANEALQGKVRSVNVDLSQTQKYDVGANCLLDVIVEEIEACARPNRRRIRWRGFYPLDASQKRLAKALGVVKFLDIKHERPEEAEASRIEAFEARCKHYVRKVRPNEADKKSRTTQKFADHINDCLRRVGSELTPSARHLLCTYVTEILDNAEEHAGMHDWVIQGYLDTHGNDWVCEIVIISFGRSIADTFQALPQDSYTYSMIAPYLLKHGSSFWSGKWTRNELFTLIALQESVSSKNHTKGDTRGNGTVDLIRFFQEVGKGLEGRPDAPVMSLISGSSRIMFDGKYSMQKNAAGLGVIAFNETNDLQLKPDPAYVSGLQDIKFPGTVLSIKFPLSRSHASMAPVTGAPS